MFWVFELQPYCLMLVVPQGIRRWVRLPLFGHGDISRLTGFCIAAEFGKMFGFLGAGGGLAGLRQAAWSSWEPVRMSSSSSMARRMELRSSCVEMSQAWDLEFCSTLRGGLRGGFGSGCGFGLHGGLDAKPYCEVCWMSAASASNPRWDVLRSKNPLRMLAGIPNPGFIDDRRFRF